MHDQIARSTLLKTVAMRVPDALRLAGNIFDAKYEDPDHLSFRERSLYVRNELGEAVREFVQLHIETCKSCAEEVRHLQAFVASLDECTESGR